MAFCVIIPVSTLSADLKDVQSRPILAVSKMMFTDYLRTTFERSKLRIDEAVDNLQQTFETADGQDAETLVEQKSVDEQAFPCKLLPRLNRGLYVARDELLKKMQKLLEKCDELWIWGVAGTGKSTVALAYATDIENYDYVLWIKAESSMSVLESFTNIARSLGLETGLGQEANRKAVLTHLSESGGFSISISLTGADKATRSKVASGLRQRGEQRESRWLPSAGRAWTRSISYDYSLRKSSKQRASWRFRHQTDQIHESRRVLAVVRRMYAAG